jgi:hypothetical protein
MSASLSPRIVELQAIPKICRRLKASVILKRRAARSARVGRPYVNGQRREELLQNAFAHAWVWLQECTLDYWAQDIISPKEAASLAAYRGADRAFDGRALPGKFFHPSAPHNASARHRGAQREPGVALRDGLNSRPVPCAGGAYRSRRNLCAVGGSAGAEQGVGISRA